MRQLNWDLKQLEREAKDGSRGKRRDRSYSLALAANTLHDLGFKGLRARGLKEKHVAALVGEWNRQGLSTGTMANRRWACPVPPSSADPHVPRRRCGTCGTSSGICRFMKPSKRGTVNAVSPWRWLQTMPFVIRRWRTLATEAVRTPSVSAI